MDIHSTTLKTEIDEKYIKKYVENVLDDLRLSIDTFQLEPICKGGSLKIYFQEIDNPTEKILDQMSVKSPDLSATYRENPSGYEDHLLKLINKYVLYSNWANQIIQLINNLQDYERCFIIFHYLRGLPFKNTAKRLGVSTRVLYRIKNNALIELGLSIPEAVKYAIENNR